MRRQRHGHAGLGRQRDREVCEFVIARVGLLKAVAEQQRVIRQARSARKKSSRSSAREILDNVWSTSAPLSTKVASGTSPSGFLNTNGLPRVYFVDATDHTIHEVGWNSASGWSESGALSPAVAADSSPSAFAWPSGGVRTYFVDAGDESIHELSYSASSGWATSAALTGPVASGTSPSGFLNTNGLPRVYFVDATDHTIHEVGWNSASGWSESGALSPAVAADSSPSAFAWPSGGVRTYFVDAGDESIHELSYSASSGWATSAALTGPVASGTSPSGFLNTNGLPRVYFVDATDHTIHEVGWNSASGWSESGALSPAVAADSSPSAFAWPSGGVRTYFVDAGDESIHELSYSASLGHKRSLDRSGCVGDKSLNALTFNSHGLPRVYFVDATDQTIHELAYLSPPVVIASPTIILGQSTATLNGVINPMASVTTCHFEYGTTSAYGSRAPASDLSAGSGISDEPVAEAISGLLPATTYHFRLVATNQAGTASSNDLEFTTLPLAPAVATNAASNVGQSATTLNGTVNPHGSGTQYHFEYGPTPSYGSKTPATGAGAGTAARSVSQPVSGLQAGTAYHYRLVATNGGGTVFGSDVVLTTTLQTHGVSSVALFNCNSDFRGCTSGHSTRQPMGHGRSWRGNRQCTTRPECAPILAHPPSRSNPQTSMSTSSSRSTQEWTHVAVATTREMGAAYGGAGVHSKAILKVQASVRSSFPSVSCCRRAYQVSAVVVSDRSRSGADGWPCYRGGTLAKPRRLRRIEAVSPRKPPATRSGARATIGGGMANYLDFLVVLDDHLAASSLGFVIYGHEMHAIAQTAGLAVPGDESAARWTGELVQLGYVVHGPLGLGDGRPLPQGAYTNYDLSRVSDYRITAAGRTEADRVRRQRREALPTPQSALCSRPS